MESTVSRNSTESQAEFFHIAALGYAARGWRVFPVSRSKIPLVRNWPSCATTDRARIEEWSDKFPTANIGVRTGATSGLVVIDVDGAEGGRALLTLPDADLFPETLTGRSSRGFHFYYRHPGGHVPSRTQFHQKPVDIIADGLRDPTKAHMVIAPPSVHKSGVRYEFLDPETPLADFPLWLLPHLLAPVAPKPQITITADFALVAPVPKLKSQPHVAGALLRARRTWAGFEQLRALRGHFTTGTRSRAVLIAAYILKRNGESYENIWSICNQLSYPPLDVDKVRRQIKTACDWARNGHSSLSRAKMCEWLRITADEFSKLVDWQPARLAQTIVRQRSRADLVSQISTMRAQQMPYREIARLLHRDPTTVFRLAPHSTAPIGAIDVDKPTAERIIQLWNGGHGLSYREIADQVPLSKSAIGRFLKTQRGSDGGARRQLSGNSQN